MKHHNRLTIMITDSISSKLQLPTAKWKHQWKPTLPANQQSRQELHQENLRPCIISRLFPIKILWICELYAGWRVCSWRVRPGMQVGESDGNTSRHSHTYTYRLLWNHFYSWIFIFMYFEGRTIHKLKIPKKHLFTLEICNMYCAIFFICLTFYLILCISWVE